jgi:hypothetical protein
MSTPVPTNTIVTPKPAAQAAQVAGAVQAADPMPCAWVFSLVAVISGQAERIV